MPSKIQMVGRKFGSLSVLDERAPYVSPRGTCKDIQWLCKCDCGNEAIVRGSYLRNGHTKSCGHCKDQVTPIIICENDYYRYLCENGDSFIFDADDLILATAYVWTIEGGYVRCNRLRFHREVFGLRDDGIVVDHINGDPTDNRRGNLRAVPQRKNTYNQGMHKNSMTGYKGVCFDKSRGKYMAHIHPDRRMVFLGYYLTPEDAAAAYNKAAITFYGENARLNIVGTPFSTVPANDVMPQRTTKNTA